MSHTIKQLGFSPARLSLRFEGVQIDCACCLMTSRGLRCIFCLFRPFGLRQVVAADGAEQIVFERQIAAGDHHGTTDLSSIQDKCIRVVRKRDGVSGKVKCEVDDRAKPEPKFDLTSRWASWFLKIKTHNAPNCQSTSRKLILKPPVLGQKTK